MTINRDAARRWMTRGGLFVTAQLAAASVSADVVVGTGQPTSQTLGRSNAVQLIHAAGGIGHGLILPYFTAQNGNATILSITNSDLLNGKAVKLKIRGAANGDSLLEATILMGPGDVWNATITQSSSGAAQISTADRTCTVPRFAPDSPQPVLTTRLNASWADSTKALHTREGYVEIVNMADIPFYVSSGTSNSGISNPLVETIRHVNGSPACDDAVLQESVLPNHTSEIAAASKGFATPTTGLVGKWTIINVPQTTTYAGSMHAIRAVDASNLDARGNFVLFPQTANEYKGSPSTVTADPLMRPVAYASKTAAGNPAAATAVAAIKLLNVDLPDLSTPYVLPPGSDAPLAQADMLSGALASRWIVNEYALDTSISAKTDWVFSAPARRYSVGTDYAAGSRRLFSMVPATGNQYYHEQNTVPSADGTTLYCASATTQWFADRNTAYKTTSEVNIFPGAPPPLALCGAVQVTSFADPTGASALGASVVRNDTGAATFVTGWGALNMTDSRSGLGHPLLGGSFIRAVNPAASPGVSGSYGMTFEHATQR